MENAEEMGFGLSKEIDPLKFSNYQDKKYNDSQLNLPEPDIFEKDIRELLFLKNDQPIDEKDLKEFKAILEGRKRLSELNFFLLVFGFLSISLERKEKDVINGIVRELYSWNSSGTTPFETDYIDSEEEINCANRLSDLSKKNPQRAIKPIQEAILKYPENVFFYNLLVICYTSVGKDYLSNEIAEIMFNKFPGHIGVFCNHLCRLCHAGRIRDMELLIDKNFNILKQFPGKEIFAPNEILAYLTVIILYYLEIKDVLKAAAYTYHLTCYDWDAEVKTTVNYLFGQVGKQVLELFPLEELAKLNPYSDCLRN
jgi:hypothetical protein